MRVLVSLKAGASIQSRLVAVQVEHQTDAEERKIQSLGLMRLELSQLCCRRGLPVPCRSSRWAAPRRRRLFQGARV